MDLVSLTFLEVEILFKHNEMTKEHPQRRIVDHKIFTWSLESMGYNFWKYYVDPNPKGFPFWKSTYNPKPNDFYKHQVPKNSDFVVH
jgi:hypothetical protein